MPVPLTNDEIMEFGHRANERLRAIQNGAAADYDPLKESEIKEMEDWPGMWSYKQFNVNPRGRGTAQGTFGTERPGFGSAVFMYHSPTDYGPVWSDISVTLVYRMQEGRGQAVCAAWRATEVVVRTCAYPGRPGLCEAVPAPQPGASHTLFQRQEPVLTSAIYSPGRVWTGGQMVWINPGPTAASTNSSEILGS